MLQLIMTPKIQFLILLLGISISVGHSKPPNKIFRGKDAPHTPYQVSILNDEGHICGGSIIDKRHIITAAHCVVYEDEKIHPARWILIGTNDQTKRNRNNVYGILKLFVHEAYSARDSWRNDIAICKVDRDIIFNEYQQAISLPISDTLVGTSLTLTGWGQTRDSPSNPKKIPQYLQTLTTYVISQNKCQQMLKMVKIREGQLCTWTDRHGAACQYDSGGPLVDGNVLVGIVSLGETSCAASLPDVFTRVYNYVPWIRAVIARSYLNNS